MSALGRLHHYRGRMETNKTTRSSTAALYRSLGELHLARLYITATPVLIYDGRHGL